MKQEAPKTCQIFRGYILHLHDGAEPVHAVLPPQDGGVAWQSRERLQQALQERVDAVKNVMSYDVAGYIETVNLERAATKT